MSKSFARLHKLEWAEFIAAAGNSGSSFIHKTFEVNFSFHVKLGKVQFPIFTCKGPNRTAARRLTRVYQFTANDHASFHWRWVGNFLSHQKVFLWNIALREKFNFCFLLVKAKTVQQLVRQLVHTSLLLMIMLHFSFGERKICSSIKKTQNIINIILGNFEQKIYLFLFRCSTGYHLIRKCKTEQ